MTPIENDAALVPPEAREEVIERSVSAFAVGLAITDDLTLTHEAERLESLPTSPVVTKMRRLVEAELMQRMREPGNELRPVAGRLVAPVVRTRFCHGNCD